MRPALQSIAVVAFLVLGQSGLWAASAPAPKQESRPDQWRYTFHNGEWWYWLPENRWVYWRNSRWNDYNAQTFVTPGSSGTVAGAYSGPRSTYRIDPGAYATDPGGEVRPFYGHAESSWGAYPSAGLGGDVRPFYGHAESNWGVYTPDETGIGPFYGRVVPSIGFRGSSSGGSEAGPFYGHAPW